MGLIQNNRGIEVNIKGRAAEQSQLHSTLNKKVPMSNKTSVIILTGMASSFSSDA